MAGLVKPTILLYSVPADIHRAIAEIGLTIGIDCKKIARARFNQKLGCHIGAPGYMQTAERYEGQELPSPMILFSGLSDRMLDSFLAAYKQAGLPEMPYRAIVTKYNINWNALDLFQELVQERESLNPGLGNY